MLLLFIGFTYADWEDTAVIYIVSVITNVTVSPINLNIWTNQTYYDVGDTVLLWTNLTYNGTYNTVYIYGSDGSIYPMTYAVSNGYWYAYWIIKQPQDYIIVESFSTTGDITGYGEIKITYNPMIVSKNWYDGILITLSVFIVPLILGGLFIIGIILFLFVIKGRVKPSLPKGPTDSGTPFRHQVGVVGQGALGSLNNVRNIGGIFTGIVFFVFTLLAVFVILSILFYVGKVFHLF